MHSARVLPLVLLAFVVAVAACGNVISLGSTDARNTDAATATPDAPFTDARTVPDGSAAQLCSTASALTADDTRSGVHPVLVSAGAVAPCVGDVVSAAVFTAELPVHSYLTLTLRRPAGTAPTVVTLDACASTTCLAQTTPLATDTSTTTVFLRNDGDTPFTRTFLVVDPDGSAPELAFDLRATIDRAPDAARCSMALRTTGSASLGPLDTTAAPATMLSCDTMQRRTVFAAIDVPGHSRVAVTAAALDTAGHAVTVVAQAALVAGCSTNDACLGTPGAHTSYLNDGAGTQQVVLALGLPPDAPLDTRVSADVQVTAAATYASCSTAPLLQAGNFTVSDTTPGGTLTVPCIPAPTDPTTQFFIVPVPAHTGVRVSATGMPGHVPQLAFVTDCTNPMCAQLGPSGTSVRAFDNSDTNITLRLVAVGPQSARAPYTLALASYEPPANIACSMATPITASTHLRDQDGADASDSRSSRCLSGDSALSVFYALTVPAGDALLVDATPHAAGNPTLRLLFDCVRASGCLASAQGFGGAQPTDLRWVNTTGATATPVLAVAANDATKLFDLDVTIAPPATNSTCVSARAITDGTVFDALAFADGRGLPGGCRTEVNTGALFFTTSIPVGSRLVATATTPAGRTVPLVRVLDSCGATQCRAVSNAGEIPARIALDNTGTQPLPVVLAVAPGDMLDAAGSYGFAVDIAPPNYTVSRVVTACDPLGVDDVLDGNGDDVIGTPVTLPFTFPLAGESVVTAAPTSDGQLLFAIAGETLSTDTRAPFQNQPIPLRQPLARFAAPFWDDLFAAAGTFRYHRFDSHVTFGWVDIVPYSTPADRLTFQVKLFPDGSTEFHYCSIAVPTDPRSTGASATVGIENGAGTRGVQFAYDTAGAIDTTQAIRFVPRTP